MKRIRVDEKAKVWRLKEREGGPRIEEAGGGGARGLKGEESGAMEVEEAVGGVGSQRAFRTMQSPLYILFLL